MQYGQNLVPVVIVESSGQAGLTPAEQRCALERCPCRWSGGLFLRVRYLVPAVRWLTLQVRSCKISYEQEIEQQQN